MAEMISPHFSKEELCCPHCGQCIITNELLAGLELLRSQGPEPIIVHDAYRCEEHNLAVGGVPHSEHPLGKAADIEIRGLSLKDMYNRAIKVPAFFNGGIGVYDGKPFIHVDVRDKQARWARINNVYEPIWKLLDV